MARPREFDIDAFLAKAMEVFWIKGFSATSMADIYAATGLGPGSVYAVVKDKDDLFRRVFERYAEHFRAMMRSDIKGLAAIEAWMHLQTQFLTEDPDRKGCLLANTIMERHAHSEETHRLAQERFAEIRDYFVAQIEAGRDEGSIPRSVNAAQAADALLGSVTGMMALARGRIGKDTLTRIAEASLDALRPVR